LQEDRQVLIQSTHCTTVRVLYALWQQWQQCLSIKYTGSFYHNTNFTQNCLHQNVSQSHYSKYSFTPNFVKIFSSSDYSQNDNF